MSHTELLAMASRLTRLELVNRHPPARDADVDLVARHLHALFRLDQEQCHDAARAACRRPLDTWEALDTALAELRSVALETVHGDPRLRDGDDAWRVTRLVDPEVLLATGAGAEAARDPFDAPSVPVLAPRNMPGVLDEESVDCHVHLAGVPGSAFYWVLLVGGSVPLAFARAMPGDNADLVGGDRWVESLATAARQRLALASLLELHHCGRERLWPQIDLGRANASPPTPWSVQEDLARLSLNASCGPSPHDAPLLRDPLRLGWAGHRDVHVFAAERRLLALAFALRPPQAAPLVLDYLRARNAFHQAVTYMPGAEGLFRFADAFRRRGFIFGAGRALAGRRRRMERKVLELERLRAQVAVRVGLVEPYPDDRHAASWPALRRTELRVSMPRGWMAKRTFAAWLRGVGDALGESPQGAGAEFQVGFVVHALRMNDRDATRRRAEDEFRRLTNLLQSHPGLRPFVVGVDVAGIERVGPPRLFAEAMAGASHVSHTFVARGGTVPLALGKTWHVGEDFRDLLTSLRHVHEALRIMLPDPDTGSPDAVRIGHGVALGLDHAAFYARRRGWSELPLGEHLLDLAWAWGRCERDVGHRHDLEDRGDLLAELHRDALRGDPVDLRKGHALLTKRKPLPHAPLLREDEVLAAWLPGLGAVKARLDPDARWLKLVAHMQRGLRAEIARLGVCVEANPTSNLLVGELAGYHHLPFWTLTDEGLRVSINTDDPGMFVTSLPREYAHLLSAMWRRGLTRPQAEAWLQARWEDGRRSTFLGRRTPRGEALRRCLRQRDEFEWLFRSVLPDRAVSWPGSG